MIYTNTNTEWFNQEPTLLQRQIEKYKADGHLQYMRARQLDVRGAGLKRQDDEVYTWADRDLKDANDHIQRRIEVHIEQHYPLVWDCMQRGLVIL